jgi:hypothetical protein
MHPYRATCRSFGKRADTVRTIRELVGNKPMLEGVEHDRSHGERFLASAFEKLSDLVSDWYVKYLAMEMKEAVHYDDAYPPASLMAFSLRSAGVQRLGSFLSSREPLHVLVAIEALGDLVALGPNGEPRSMAAYYLGSSRIPLARLELEEAVAFSDLEPPAPYIPLSALPPIPFAGFAASRYYIPL